LECCISFWVCFQAIQATLQCFVQFICFFGFCILCWVYDHSATIQGDSEEILLLGDRPPTKKGVSILFATILTVLATIGISLIPLKEIPLILGLIATCCSCIQFIPQVITTILHGFQSLSIVMLLIQFPGSIVFVYSILKQQGTDWTSWITFFVCGIFQLLLILIYCYQNTLGVVPLGYQPVPGEEAGPIEEENQDEVAPVINE
jgi:hypothetical protein